MVMIAVTMARYGSRRMENRFEKLVRREDRKEEDEENSEKVWREDMQRNIKLVIS